jgi:predicted alpha/beta-fold hydrolase
LNKRRQNPECPTKGVQVSEVKTTEVFYNGTSTVEGRTAVYWEKNQIGASEQFMVGVSFPAQ